ncbi:hypothetical protein K3F43_01755 [Pseudomonas tussilaginis]|uniref:hypothetical protein n=1 Tax=unclassified Pseudomonas TaxID=196821 RepID=UPI000C6D30DE|nr:MULTISPECIES: hypothetical protein [unclassified Pseudomonas]QYX48270.1 hypothetical protein K3F43_01755 [Pseudomonas sp. S11A 273]
MYDLHEIEKKYEEVGSECERYLSDYMSSVSPELCRSVISKGAMYNLRPYEVERAGYKKGRKLNKLPVNIKNTHVYHFDERGRVIFIEIYGQAENIVNKEFCFYGDGCLERIHFTSSGDLRNISVSIFDGDLVRRDLNWGMFGCSISDYVYSGSRLSRIRVQQKEHAESSFSGFDVVFEYCGEELESIINIFPNGYQEQRFP